MGTQTTVINPRYVYVQATEPTDKTEGKIWYKTTTDLLYASDGSSYVLMTTDLTSINTKITGIKTKITGVYSEQVQQNINILINAIASSSTLEAYDEMYLDIITDNDGEDNTIDTGNTTAIFDTNKYKNPTTKEDGDDVTETNPNTTWSSDTGYKKCGVKVQFANTHTGLTVTRATGGNATKCYIQTAMASGVLATETFDENGVAVFTGLSLSASTDYYILNDSDDENFTIKYQYSTTPSDTGEVNWVGCVNQGSEYSDQSSEIQSITYTEKLDIPANGFVQTNALTVSDDAVDYLLYCHNAVAGSGNVTYDISFDNGANYETGKTLNTKYTRTEASSKQIITKINLNGVGAGNTSEVSDYSLLLTY